MEQYLWTRGVQKWVQKYLFQRHNPYGNTESRICRLGMSRNGSGNIYSGGTFQTEIYGAVSMDQGCPEMGPEIFIPVAQSIWKYREQDI